MSVDSGPPETRRPLRAGALSLAVMMLLTACATGSPPGARTRGLTGASAEPQADGVGPEAVFVRRPTDFAPVRVGESELKAALTTLWLEMPSRMATPRPALYVGRRLALAAGPTMDLQAIKNVGSGLW